MTDTEAPAGPYWRQLAVLPLLFYAGAKLSLAFAVMPEVLVMLWIPNSIILAALLHFDGRRYGAVAALVIAAEIAADYPTFPIIEAVLFGTINVLEVTIAWLLLRHWKFDPRFTSPADIAKFVFAAPAAAAFIAACAGAATYRLGGTTTSFTELLRVWWFSDGLGLLIMTPLVLLIWPPRPPLPEEPIRVQWWDGVAIVLSLIIAAAFAFSRQRVIDGVTIRSFILIPPVLYCAARYNLRVTTSVVATAAGLVLFVTKNGQQPFGNVPLRETATSAQELIFIMAAMSLGIGTLLSQHRRNALQLEARIRDRTAALIAANEQLQQLAITDSLTGLFNRRALFDVMQREIERQKRYQRGLAVIMFDLDHFKQINDHYGHAAGDDVLRYVGAVTKRVVRSTDVAARYGGEEFVIIAPETDHTSALQLAERLRTELREGSVESNGQRVQISASFGIALMLPEESSADEVLGRADHALYAAKAAGRDRVSFDDQSLSRSHFTM